jgi:hypothetical protein
MPTEFLAEELSSKLTDAVAALAPANPHATPAYAEVMKAEGFQAWALGSVRDRELVAGCYGFLRKGRLNRLLKIPSLPDLSHTDPFWEGLLGFSAEQGVTSLELDTLASPGARIPALGREILRRCKREYILNLRDSAWEQRLHRNHRRNIEKARKANVTLLKTTSAEACLSHVQLMEESMRRRRSRGERAPEIGQEELGRSQALVAKGCGVLFQATSDGGVLSSLLVIKSHEGAYCHTGGTSALGMQRGACHFVYFEAARSLQRQGLSLLNFGDGGNEPGLELFKELFGTTQSPTEYAMVYLGGVWRRRLTRVVELLRGLAGGRREGGGSVFHAR